MEEKNNIQGLKCCELHVFLGKCLNFEKICCCKCFDKYHVWQHVVIEVHDFKKMTKFHLDQILLKYTLTKFPVTRFSTVTKIQWHWWDFKGKIVSFQVHNKELITVLTNFDSFISNKDVCDAVWYYWYCCGTDKLLWYWTYEWQKCQITNSDMSLYDNHIMVILIGYFPVRVSYKRQYIVHEGIFMKMGKVVKVTNGKILKITS